MDLAADTEAVAAVAEVVVDMEVEAVAAVAALVVDMEVAAAMEAEYL